MNEILEMLQGGDRRSIGRADEVVERVWKNPSDFKFLFQGFYENDPVIRMRTADAVEKITATAPELLIPYKQDLLDLIHQIDQMEVLWHFAQIIPRLHLSPDEMNALYPSMVGYLSHPSAIVKTFTLQCLYDLSLQEPTLLPATISHLQDGLKCSQKAVQSRSRKLLALLEKENHARQNK
ncbi:MAG: hypothetical protein GYA52_10300 [Chloroflexi bacterium]|nr:hypothetical protein [Chloroflexota bacterium]